MNQKIKNVLIILLIYLSSVALSLILAIIVGSLYSNIFNLSCANSIFIAMNFDKGCRIEGFIYTYSFLLPLFSFLLLKTKKALLNYFFGIVLFISFFFFVGYYKGLFIYLLMLIFSWLLAQGGLLVYKKLKK